MGEICVVHLIRAHNGLEPFQEFVRAYTRYSAGIDHDLILVFKGFGKNSIPSDYRRVASDLRYRSLFVRDWGFDLRPYGLAARSFAHSYFCFLNSYSQPLEAGWLAKLSHCIHQAGAGLVGATGSWESMYSNMFVESPSLAKPSPLQRLWQPVRLQLCRLFFAPFPNWHLRTNAFMAPRNIILHCWPDYVITKRNAYLFENGKRSLTRQVMQMGLRVSVVGRDGRAYAKEDWPASNTYRIGCQKNLLVADTQTKQFERADAETKRYLSRLAWGDQPDVMSL